MVFCLLWAIVFVLYLPAAKAGFVTDFTGWLDQIRNRNFWVYVNRSEFHVHSLYQFTQFNTYLLYQLFGINAWLWHLLFITLHAINACLMFTLSMRLLNDFGAENSGEISFAGASLFCLSPYISEVIVWEPAFHFLQGLLLILVCLLCAQKFINTGARKYAIWTSLIYFLSTYSLELFYVTPWLVMIMGIFYSYHPAYEKIASKVMLWVFAPMLLLFLARLVAFRLVYGDWVSRIGSGTVSAVQLASFGKPAKYLFHLLFLGRFFPQETRQRVYDFCDSITGIVLFYGLIIAICGYIFAQFGKMSGKGKFISLLFGWTLITLMLLIPLWFEDILLVIFDRYTYLTSAFLYMLVAAVISLISFRYVTLGIAAVYALVNLRFAIMVSRYWGKAYRVDHGLLTKLPEPDNKLVILLNLPESMHGVPMIGSEKESEFKLMHNLLLPGTMINNTVYDALSYNMVTPEDGAHVTVINDSMIRVTLNQWGTWWWYAGKGGYSYQNENYKLNLIDGGHFYEMTLKKPAQDYLLLYQVADRWKVVDINKKNQEQN